MPCQETIQMAAAATSAGAARVRGSSAASPAETPSASPRLISAIRSAP